MEKYLLTLLGLILCSCTRTDIMETDREANMNNYKKDVTLWYEAFTNKDSALLDRILHETCVDIP